MSLLVRINVVLVAGFALSAVAVGVACSAALQANAKRDVLRQASLMMDSALATRAYTEEEIRPLLESQMPKRFLAQSVPSYGATQDFLKLHERHPEYAYKEAALNPTNLRDRAMDWEADLIQKFRNDPKTTELVGERDTPLGRSLYLARPIRAEANCLRCHSVPGAAPAALLTRYGSANGFGWQEHEIVAAQVVSVPFSNATAQADATFLSIMMWIVGILVVALLGVNLVLYFLVVRPVRRIVSIADELSVGNVSAPDFPTSGSAELVGLGRAFNRMRTSLDKAMKLLEG